MQLMTRNYRLLLTLGNKILTEGEIRALKGYNYRHNYWVLAINSKSHRLNDDLKPKLVEVGSLGYHSCNCSPVIVQCSEACVRLCSALCPIASPVIWHMSYSNDMVWQLLVLSLTQMFGSDGQRISDDGFTMAQQFSYITNDNEHN